MKKIIPYILITFTIAQDFIPEDQKFLNYNQIYFKWPQINNSEYYKIYLNETNIYLTDINSIIIDSLSWNTEYSWYVCGFNNVDNLLYCYDEKIFFINELPMNFPANLEVITLNFNDYNPGYTLLDFESLNFSVVLDFDGSPIWFADRMQFENSRILVSQLSDNGNFIGFGAGGGYEFNIDSEIIYQIPTEYDLHHLIYKSINETYFFIDAEIEYHPCPIECDFPNDIPWQGDRFIEIDINGNILWEWNTFNYLSLDEYNPFWMESYNGNDEFDWTHSNSLFFDSINEIIYISIRNLSRITAIDYNTKDIIWNLGNPDFMNDVDFDEDFGFSHQHSAKITSNNNLLFFDNGRDNIPEISRCIEIEFNQEQIPQIYWEYMLPDTLLTLSRGECDRLDNGNTLISVGRTGNVIEVNQSNEIVWHLIVKTANGNDVSIYRSERINSLYPNIFSFDVVNLSGVYENYFIENNLEEINIRIDNIGWKDQTYKIELYNQNEIVFFSEELFVMSNEQANFLIDINFNSQNNYFKIYPINNIELSQILEFSFSNLIGDINEDYFININDIIALVDIIFNSEFFNYADFNDDLSIDIFDIILLINIIL